MMGRSWQISRASSLGGSLLIEWLQAINCNCFPPFLISKSLIKNLQWQPSSCLWLCLDNCKTADGAESTQGFLLSWWPVQIWAELIRSVKWKSDVNVTGEIDLVKEPNHPPWGWRGPQINIHSFVFKQVSTVSLDESTWVALTKCHMLDDLKDIDLFSHSSGGCQSKIKVLSGFVCGDSSPLGLQTASFFRVLT